MYQERTRRKTLPTIRTVLTLIAMICATQGTFAQIANRSGSDSTIYVSSTVFVPKTAYQSGQENWGLDIGDIDKDGDVDVITCSNLDGLITGKRLHSGLTVFFNSGAYVEWSENPELQRTTSPLRLASKAPRLPVGRYAWNEHRLTGTTDPSRMVSLSGTVTWGGLWSGDQKTVNATLTVKPSYRFRTSVGVQHTDADLAAPVGSFTTDLYTMRTNYSFNTQMFLDALMQYSTDLRQLNANIRFNLIHRPLSDIYVVYNEQRFTDDDAPAAGRGVIVKYTHMLAF